MCVGLRSSTYPCSHSGNLAHNQEEVIMLNFNEIELLCDVAVAGDGDAMEECSAILDECALEDDFEAVAEILELLEESGVLAAIDAA